MPHLCSIPEYSGLPVIPLCALAFWSPTSLHGDSLTPPLNQKREHQPLPPLLAADEDYPPSLLFRSSPTFPSTRIPHPGTTFPFARLRQVDHDEGYHIHREPRRAGRRHRQYQSAESHGRRTTGDVGEACGAYPDGHQLGECRGLFAAGLDGKTLGPGDWKPDIFGEGGEDLIGRDVVISKLALAAPLESFTCSALLTSGRVSCALCQSYLRHIFSDALMVPAFRGRGSPVRSLTLTPGQDRQTDQSCLHSVARCAQARRLPPDRQIHGREHDHRGDKGASRSPWDLKVVD